MATQIHPELWILMYNFEHDFGTLGIFFTEEDAKKYLRTYSNDLGLTKDDIDNALNHLDDGWHDFRLQRMQFKEKI